MRLSEPRPVRLLGVALGSLVANQTPTQLSLFEDPLQKQAERRVDRVVDELSNQLGDKTVYRAASHRWRKRK